MLVVLVLSFADSAETCAAAIPAERNDYANRPFADLIDAGMQSFYTRRFRAAEERFAAALTIVPDNTLAISFLDASATNISGEIEQLVAREARAVDGAPFDYAARVRLGFAELFASAGGRNRDARARDEFTAAVAIAPRAQAAHVGLGIIAYGERTANRAKLEFLAALESDANNVLSREYLGQIYQLDLHDPQRGLAYLIDVPNVVPGYADINFHLGSLFYDLKAPDAAIRYATRGLEIDVGHVGEAGRHGYTLLARVYLDAHKLDDARRVLNAAIAADTDAPYARSMLAKMPRAEGGNQRPAGFRP